MTDDHRRKKRSEKLSDSFAAKLGRETSAFSEPATAAGDARRRNAHANDPTILASMQSQRTHSFARCPHCREYVPIRESCRSCGGPMS